MENKRLHLELIQGVINRMAGNLFFLRGWSITLITGVLTLSTAKGQYHGYILLTYFLLFIFWILDGYFLSQERQFRCLYDDVRSLNEKDIDFSMSREKYNEVWHNTWLGSIISKTLLWFYIPLALAILVVLWLINK